MDKCPISNNECKENKSHHLSEIGDNGFKILILCDKCAANCLHSSLSEDKKIVKIVETIRELLNFSSCSDSQIFKIESYISFLKKEIKESIELEKYEYSLKIDKILKLYELYKSEKEILKERQNIAIISGNYEEANSLSLLIKENDKKFFDIIKENDRDSLGHFHT